MLKRKKISRKLKGSVLFSSILVLVTTILFIQMYQNIFVTSMENNMLIIKILTE